MCYTIKYHPLITRKYRRKAINSTEYTIFGINVKKSHKSSYFDWGNRERSGNGTHCFFRRRETYFLAPLYSFWKENLKTWQTFSTFEILQICRWSVWTQCCTRNCIVFYCQWTWFDAIFCKALNPNRKKCCTFFFKFGHNSSKELICFWCGTLNETNKANIHFSQKK